MATYYDQSAYGHSFPPASSARYVLSQVESGTNLDAALRQASVEHGPAQAREVESLLSDELRGKQSGDRRSLLPALRRVIRRAERAASEIRAERARNNECRECGASLDSRRYEYRSPGEPAPTLCHACEPVNYACANGHRWSGKDTSALHRCPKCGEYYV